MLVGKVVDKFEVDGKEVVLRYPTMRDVEDLQEQINSLIEEGAKITYEEKKNYEEEVDWLSDNLKKIEKEEKVLLVVKVDGKVMGSTRIDKEEGNMSHLGEFGITLREEIRSKGIGTKLSKAVISEAKERLDIEIVKLQAFDNNEVAKGLYRKLGFEKVGRIKDAIKRDGKYIDKVIMQKDLRD